MQKSLVQTLVLLNLPGCGAATFWKLLDAFGSLEQLFNCDPPQLDLFLKPPAIARFIDFQQKGDESQAGIEAEKEIALCEHLGIQLITPQDATYPELLLETKRHPPLLYVAGRADVLKLPQIALVGSRKPTPTGQLIAGEFAEELSAKGFVITSGLALGIDASAHRGALRRERPTVAVLGSGLSRIYPSRHAKLAKEIVSTGGALVSEFPLDAVAKPSHFPQRNRIVSGLSIGTVVIEAALKSGSLITARFALQQNREVFAVPGSIRSEASRGCHAMIKSGATLVERPKDIVQELSGALAYYTDLLPEPDLSKPQQLIQKETIARNTDSSKNKKVLACVGYDAMPIEQIAHLANMSIDVLSAVLLELEFSGLIENTGMGYIKL